MIPGEYIPKSIKETTLINTLNIACLLNIALCYQCTKEWSHCIRACDEILNVFDDRCVKALYRRAMARILPPSCGGLENSIALKDLKLCLSVLLELINNENNENNEVESKILNNYKNLYATVHSEYTKLSKELREVYTKDKNRNMKMFKMTKDDTNSEVDVDDGIDIDVYNGDTNTNTSGSGSTNNSEKLESNIDRHMNSSGNSSNIKHKHKQVPISLYCDNDNETSNSHSPTDPTMMTIGDVIIAMRDMDSAATGYQHDGKMKEYRDMKAKIASMQTILDEHRASKDGLGASTTSSSSINTSSSGSQQHTATFNNTTNTANINRTTKPIDANIDFTNPTAAMIKDAKDLHGLDLTDKRCVCVYVCMCMYIFVLSLWY